MSDSAPPTISRSTKSYVSTIASARLDLISHNIMSSELAPRFAAQTVNYFAGYSLLFPRSKQDRKSIESMFSFAAE